VAVLSDFQATGYERPLGILRRRHDVVALHFRDPGETEVPPAGLVALRDPETGERRVVDTSDPAVRRLLARPAAAELADVCRRTNVDLLSLSTAESYERPLARFFKAREKRR
jgi:hypothetical protein